MTCAQIIDAVGTFFLVVIAFFALFQDKIRIWLFHPKLSVSIKSEPPDCLKTVFYIPIGKQGTSGSTLSQKEPPTSGSALFPSDDYRGGFKMETEAYFIRLKIENTGNEKAESVEVYANELSRKQADGSFKLVESFLPMNFKWSYIHEEFMPAISPNTYKHCDLAHIFNPVHRKDIPLEDKSWPNVDPDQTILSFDTIAKPYALNHLICPGIYRLVFTVAAANSRPIKRTLEINITGNWYDDETKMLGEGIGLGLK